MVFDMSVPSKLKDAIKRRNDHFLPNTSTKITSPQLEVKEQMCLIERL